MLRAEIGLMMSTSKLVNCYFCLFSNQQPGILPRDCSEILEQGSHASGEYVIQPVAVGRPFRVYCDMTTEGGGWTVCINCSQLETNQIVNVVTGRQQVVNGDIPPPHF